MRTKIDWVVTRCCNDCGAELNEDDVIKEYDGACGFAEELCALCGSFDISTVTTCQECGRSFCLEEHDINAEYGIYCPFCIAEEADES